MWLPLLLLGSGVTALAVFAFSTFDGPVPNHQPDEEPAPTRNKTGYKLVDAILDQLRQAAATSGIPLGVLVGWIAKESGGKLTEAPKALKGEPDSERGLFQLTPSESTKLGLDHARLSTDLVYSINAGLLLIGSYMRAVEALNVAARGSTFYWMLVKLAHTMGVGSLQKIVTGAKNAGQAHSWSQLEDWALEHDSDLLHETKHSPKKWFPLIDAVYRVGAPFGFGDDSSSAIVGAEDLFEDIVDPLDCLKKA